MKFLDLPLIVGQAQEITFLNLNIFAKQAWDRKQFL